MWLYSLNLCYCLLWSGPYITLHWSFTSYGSLMNCPIHSRLNNNSYPYLSRVMESQEYREFLGGGTTDVAKRDAFLKATSASGLRKFMNGLYGHACAHDDVEKVRGY
jgi:hypothetical protein